MTNEVICFPFSVYYPFPFTKNTSSFPVAREKTGGDKPLLYKKIPFTSRFLFPFTKNTSSQLRGITVTSFVVPKRDFAIEGKAVVVHILARDLLVILQFSFFLRDNVYKFCDTLHKNFLNVSCRDSPRGCPFSFWTGTPQKRDFA
jgi:hypothetical protein